MGLWSKPPAIRTAAIIGGFYFALCVAIVFDLPLLPSRVMDAIPRWLGAALVSAIGPAALLAAGAWGLFFCAWVGIAACAAFAFFCWRRFPDSEAGVVGVLGAVAIWVACGWLTVAAAL